MEYSTAKLLFNEPIEISPKVFVHVPKVREIIDIEEEFNRHILALTVMTRQIFVESRDVDRIEFEFPTVWNLMCSPELNIALGGITGQKDKRLSDLIIDAISYWTKLPNPSKEEIDSYTDEQKKDKSVSKGFEFLENNKKIINYDTEWIIDEKEFEKFVDLIKMITDYREPDDLAPKIKSDVAHQTWLNMYHSKQKVKKKKGSGWADKIIMLSISTNSYIPPDEIGEMSIFYFNQLFKAIGTKEAYETNMEILMSPKFASKDKKAKMPTHWRESYRISNVTKEIK